MTEARIGNQILTQGLYWRSHKLFILLLDAPHDAALSSKLRAIGNVDMPNET